jgi:tRNA A-37 threonylcarbamoyl transferase component Bud32
MSEQPGLVAHEKQPGLVAQEGQPEFVAQEGTTDPVPEDVQPELVAQEEKPPELVAPEKLNPIATADDDKTLVSGDLPSASHAHREREIALKPYQQTEVLIQYGHLEEDLQQLAMATHRQTERQQEFGLAMIFGMAAPFVTIETIYASFKMLAPELMVTIARMTWPDGQSHTPEFLADQFHGLLYAIGGPIIIVGLILFGLYRLHALGPWGPFAPTHIGLLPSGVRRHWKSLFVSWTPGLRPWNEVKSVELREYGRKKQRKRITLRYAKRRPLSIEVTAIRRNPEKEALANALRFYLPTHVQGELPQLLEKTLPKQNRYTEIWTQALLNRPQRLLLTALAPQTVLHEGLYTIKEQIGAGGQGTAYLAESAHGLISDVVLKEYVLPDHNNVHDRRRALKRLEDEVQILSRLSHPQIVRLHDVFIEDHRAYLVLDYIDGPSLKSIIGKDGKFDVAKTTELALQMCAMLNYLHSLSPPLVHQDFTPDNLLLTTAGILKLVDFNVAKESATTKTSLVVGKQCYMPPEQFRGKTSVQSDIYAMGASLFFLLTGKDPEPLTASHPRNFIADVPEELDRIIARSTALDPESRYSCAADFENDLRNFAESLGDVTAAIEMEPV